MYDFDIVVIGGGSGGLVVVSAAAQMGLRVLLIEKNRLGGDCLWTGCVPSKALIAIGERIHDVRTTDAIGLPKIATFSPDFKKVMGRMRDVQKVIEPHDSPKRFEKMGATVRFGSAQFVAKHMIELDGERITFKYAVIATGSSPRVPKIEGLDDVGYLTNESLFEIKTLPKDLVIVGGGPIGIEMAQAFVRFGSKVRVLVRSKLLGKEDSRIVEELQNILESEGVEFLFGAVPTAVKMKGKKKEISLDDGSRIMCDDMMLLAVGRVPNTSNLGLDTIGVDVSKRGVVVDPYLRTSVKNIFAIGDVVGRHQFTHMASSHAGTVMRNIVTPLLKSKAETQVIPWVTYTDPELARVGLIASEAEEKGIVHKEYSVALKENDRAIAQGRREGQIRVVATPKGKVLGVSILGAHAGELLSEWTLAMQKGLTLQDIAGTIHPYPTLSEVNKAAAGAVYKEKLTARTKKIIQFLVRYVKR